MKTQVWVYIVVVVLSAGAGVAIAGLPSSTPREPTIVPPTSVDSAVPVDEDEAAMFEPVIVDADGESATGEAAAVAEPAADVVESTTSEVETTTTSVTTTTTLPPLPGREVFPVAVANGSGGAGIASAGAAELADLGYSEVRAVDGDEIVDLTIVYYAPDLERFAERLVVDLGLPADRVAALETAPPVPSLQDEPLLVYLGLEALEG